MSNGWHAKTFMVITIQNSITKFLELQLVMMSRQILTKASWCLKFTRLKNHRNQNPAYTRVMNNSMRSKTRKPCNIIQNVQLPYDSYGKCSITLNFFFEFLLRHLFNLCVSWVCNYIFYCTSVFVCSCVWI